MALKSAQLKSILMASALTLGLVAAGGALAQGSNAIPAAVSAIAPGKARVPTDWFAEGSFMQGVTLSPDGSKAVLRLSNGKQDYIGILDVTASNAKPDLFIAVDEFREAGDRTIGGYRWVGNDVVVLQMYSREDIISGRDDIGRLVSYNLGTKKLTPLAWEGSLGNASDILHVNHDRQRILLQRYSTQGGNTERSRLPEVVEVDVKSGRMTVTQRPNPVVGGWYADADGQIRMGVSSDRDSGKTRIMYRKDGSGAFDTISNSADKSFTGAGIRPLVILPGSDEAIVSDNRDGFAKLYRVNLSTMEYSKPIFQTKGYDVEGVELSYDGKRVLGYNVTDQSGRTIWTDKDFKQVEIGLDQQFGKGNWALGSRDRAEEKMVVFVAKPSQPGQYFLYDTKSGVVRPLGWRNPNVRDANLNAVSAFTYTATDGQPIEAIMTWPRHRRQTTGLPLVILTHGGPFGPRDEVRYDSWAQAVAELGYVVVQPNYRGSGGYGTEFIKKGRNDGFGLRMQDDLNDVITHLSRQGTIDSKRVCMMGWSYGGYASARAAQRDADKFRCTIAGAGVYDLAMMRAYDAEYLGKFGSNYLAKGAADLNSVSPARNTGGKWAPIMIVHGVRDDRVPVAQARTLVSRLKSSGKVQGTDFEYLEQPKNTHNLPYRDVRLEWLSATEKWLAKHNPAYVAGDSDKPVPVVTAAR